MAARSARTKELDGWRKDEKLAVRVRARDYCEAWWPGQAPGFKQYCVQPGTEVHHNYGRSPEPWASSRHLCSLLCRSHHAAVTGQVGKGLDLVLRLRLRADAAKRAWHAIGGPLELANSEEDLVAWLQGQLPNWKHYGVVPPEYDEFRRSHGEGDTAKGKSKGREAP